MNGGSSTNKGHDRKKSLENELKFNLDDSAEQVLDEQKENGCKMVQSASHYFKAF